RDTAQKLTASLELTAANEPFAFSALPNTELELEAALHLEELPHNGFTAVTVLGASRGVGGIDSWGTDVEPAYRLDGASDHRAAFRIMLR
ncbi:MAG: beta-galactosidase small subunit, partial [Gemmiger sp.]|nr:beta-galactosidase small subunit [Gemmiger sp.]